MLGPPFVRRCRTEREHEFSHSKWLGEVLGLCDVNSVRSVLFRIDIPPPARLKEPLELTLASAVAVPHAELTRVFALAVFIRLKCAKKKTKAVAGVMTAPFTLPECGGTALA
jgi:hypothetical protein